MNENEPVHPWHHCHNCKASPIVGLRYHCETCPAGPDTDLCQPCYELLQKNEIQHPLENTPAFAGTHSITPHRFTAHEGKPLSQFLHWFEVTPSHAPEPKLAHPFIVRPIFTTNSDSIIGGYAFVANVGNNGHRFPILLTAFHVMDPIIKQSGIDCTGQNPHYTGKEIPERIRDVSIFDVMAPNWMMASLGEGGSMLVLPDARVDDEEPYSNRDIAAFRVKDTRGLQPADLAPKPPEKGETIWLVTRHPEKPGPRLYKAVVVEITDRVLVYMYADGSQPPKYSSGAPLVNRKGEVVGILVGGGCLNGHVLGHANHAGNIHQHLAAFSATS
ncbi:MAG: trypsin-like peptidase domain-containing protein [Candidatus Omnitrophota bacterium]